MGLLEGVIYSKVSGVCGIVDRSIVTIPSYTFLPEGVPIGRIPSFLGPGFEDLRFSYMVICV